MKDPAQGDADQGRGLRLRCYRLNPHLGEPSTGATSELYKVRTDEEPKGLREMGIAPAPVSILRQGPHLIASIHSALDDAQMIRFQQDLINGIGQHRCRGVIIDVAALDVLDSFGCHTLRTIAEMARLRGATTVIVGIQPHVAFTIAQLGLAHLAAPTAIDLDEGLVTLTACLRP